MGIFNLFSGNPKSVYIFSKNSRSEEIENYKEIFKILKIPCDFLEDFNSGYEEFMNGNRKTARTIARKNFEMLGKGSVKRVVVSDSSLFYMFKMVYPKLLLNFDIYVEHVSSTILEVLRKKGIRFTGVELETFYYHDPCYLGRHFGIFDEPRKVIELLGGKIIEMKKNRENSVCCGAGGGLKENFPDISLSMAKNRVMEISDESLKLISPCSFCVDNLRKVKENSFEWSGFVLGRLRRLRK